MQNEETVREIFFESDDDDQIYKMNKPGSIGLRLELRSTSGM